MKKQRYNILSIVKGRYALGSPPISSLSLQRALSIGPQVLLQLGSFVIKSATLHPQLFRKIIGGAERFISDCDTHILLRRGGSKENLHLL
jgi:hypothetical protein